MDLVSVIMPAYNAQQTLAAAARSVLDQSHEELELLVIDDGSADSTGEIARGIARRDGRVRVVRSVRNYGVASARNLGIEQARGRYIAFLDADDLWLPRKLEKQLKLMREQGAHACMSSYYRFVVPGQWLCVTRPPPSVGYAQLLRGNVVGNLTGIYECGALGKFPQRNIFHEDYLMWLQVARRAGRILAVREPLAAYRVGRQTLSSNKIRSVGWTWKIYREHLGLPPLQSAYFLLHGIGRAILKRL